MRHTISTLFVLGLTLAAQAYPVVSSDANNVELNVWNTNLAQAKAKAKELGRPTLLVMLDTVNCSYSRSWVANIADTPQWQTFLQANPLILVFADKTKVDSATWYSLTAPYRDSAGYIYFPTVVMFRPDGTRADLFLARSALGSNPGFYTRVSQTTDQYPYSGGTPPATQAGTIGFSQSAVSVSEGAGAVSISVVRSGGTLGAQTYSYATEPGTALDGVNYTGTSGTLSWSDGDASAKTITVPLLNDSLWTAPTARTFAIRLTRTSGTATTGTSALTVTVNEVTAQPPATVAPAFVTPTPASGATVSVVQNTAVSIQTAASGTAPITFSASGLPAGLGIDPATGLISGTPTAAALAAVTVRAANSKGTAAVSFTIRVTTQAKAAAGSYRGFFYEPDQQTVRGTLTLTAGATGTITAQAVLDNVSYAFTGVWQTGTPLTAELQPRTGTQRLSIQVDDLGILTGSFSDAALFGRRTDASRAPSFAGYYTSVLSPTAVLPNSDEIDNQPEGSGYLTFTVDSRGGVRYSGMLADGTSFSGSSALTAFSGSELADLGYTGAIDGQAYACFPVYVSLYSKRGVLAAQIWIDGDATSSPSDNTVLALGTAWVYPGRSSTYPADGFVATLDDGDFTSIGAAFVKPANLAGAFDGTSLQTDSGSAPVEASGTSVKLASGNELNATITASTSTGIFSGTLLYTTAEGVAVSARYTGVLVPSFGVGAGYFLLSDTAFPGYTVKRSKSVVVAP